MTKWKKKIRLNNEEVAVSICRSMKQSGEIEIVSFISYKVESVCDIQTKERLGVEVVAALIMNFDSDGIEEYGSLVATLESKVISVKTTKNRVGYEGSLVYLRETIY